MRCNDKRRVLCASTPTNWPEVLTEKQRPGPKPANTHPASGVVRLGSTLRLFEQPAPTSTKSAVTTATFDGRSENTITEGPGRAGPWLRTSFDIWGVKANRGCCPCCDEGLAFMELLC